MTQTISVDYIINIVFVSTISDSKKWSKSKVILSLLRIFVVEEVEALIKAHSLYNAGLAI